MKFFERKTTKSAKIARDRLRLVLEHDRKGVTPEYFEEMQQEIIKAIQEVVKKYTHTEKIELKNQNDKIEIEIILK